MVAGVEPLLLETVVIGLGIGDSARKRSIRRCSRAGCAWRSGPWHARILDVLVARVAALMAGDELGVEVDADAVGIGFEGQAAVSVLRRGRNSDWCRG